MDNEKFNELLISFLTGFNMVFDHDWTYTKHCLSNEHIDQFISKAGTFQNPKVSDEISDWGNRSSLLTSYRDLIHFIDKNNIGLDFYDENKNIINLLAELPGELPVNSETFVAEQTSWRKITPEEISNVDYCHLKILKHGDFYAAGYYYLGTDSFIAFHHDSHGYHNLFAISDNVYETLSKLDHTLKTSLARNKDTGGRAVSDISNIIDHSTPKSIDDDDVPW